MQKHEWRLRRRVGNRISTDLGRWAPFYASDQVEREWARVRLMRAQLTAYLLDVASGLVPDAFVGTLKRDETRCVFCGAVDRPGYDCPCVSYAD